jgi:hypothetical protein
MRVYALGSPCGMDVYTVWKGIVDSVRKSGGR